MTRKETTHGGAEAIILAGGSGTRMGGDKQYLPLAGRPMLEWTVEAFTGSGLFSSVILALGPENLKKHGAAWARAGVKTVPAGATRMASLKNAFRLVSPGAALVAVHDGARPFADKQLIKACLDRAGAAGAAGLLLHPGVRAGGGVAGDGLLHGRGLRARHAMAR